MFQKNKTQETTEIVLRNPPNMFNFIKKGTGTVDKEDKERKKSEKKERKENKKREKRSMTAEELLRLDEMRRSLKIRRKKEKDKLPSGITADYSANFLAELREYAENDSIASVKPTSNHNTPILSPDAHEPPLPPKRGILKTSGKSSISVVNQTDSSSTIHNVINTEYSLTTQKTSDSYVEQCLSPEDTSSIGSGDQAHFLAPSVVVTNHGSIESLEDSTTNSSFVTPPISLSPVGGDSHYLDIEFSLPDIESVTLPEPRTLIIYRQSPPRTDFGFSLRKAMVIKRDGSGICYLKPVTFAEPGAIAQHCNDTGLLPGDQLLEVNGLPIDKKSREEVIDMIKSSGNVVTLKSKCEKESPVEAEWVWLVHQSGFSQVYKQGTLNNKISVQCPSSGESVLVDEDDLEKV
ncbi:hypothetical protein AAG570_012957 [Ranatra chinensis]|uniref:PDZ domain-containing protein n=1 Tax=Ranatra chinensis TaxID=642074 RepID=A0ABD0YFX4_9HEMI